MIEPSPTCTALASTEPQASTVPAARPQARPMATARPPGLRVGDQACPALDTAVPAETPATIGVPPTQAIKAVAEGPEPVFLRRRAVIVRHYGSPLSSRTAAYYRFTAPEPGRSLIRTNAVPMSRYVHDIALAVTGSAKGKLVRQCTSPTEDDPAWSIAIYLLGRPRRGAADRRRRASQSLAPIVKRS